MEKAHTGARRGTIHRYARLGACGLELIAVSIARRIEHYLLDTQGSIVFYVRFLRYAASMYRATSLIYLHPPAFIMARTSRPRSSDPELRQLAGSVR